MEYYVLYQRTPWDQFPAETMIVEAESKPQAFLVAWDALTRRGVVVSQSVGELAFSKEERAVVAAAKLPKCQGQNIAYIREVKEYTLKPPGSVVRG